MKLGDLCDVRINFPEADFWIQNKGTDIGSPTETFSAELIGVKVTATDQLVPKYLYYWFQYIQGQGLFKDVSLLRARDIKNMLVEMRS